MSTNHLLPHNDPAPDTEFHQFSLLPPEIRRRVWRLCVGERLLCIRLTIENGTDTGDPTRDRRLVPLAKVAADIETGGPGQPAHDQGYCLIVEADPRHAVPVLLRVCREARDAMEQIYRVRLSCRYEVPTSTTGPDGKPVAGAKAIEGTLWCDPDYDTFKIYPGRGEHLLKFAQDVHANDPRGVGLINIAMEAADINRIGTVSTESSETVRKAWVDVLGRLENVTFVSVEEVGRTFLGPFGVTPDCKFWEIHRTRPVIGAIPSFKRFSRDPRNIEHDLTRVHMGSSDPRRMVMTWNQLLSGLDVQPHKNLQQRWMLAHHTLKYSTRNIVDRTSAIRWICEEEQQWLGKVGNWKYLYPHLVKIDTAEQLKTVARTAVGFWLFPLEALGDVPHHSTTAAELKNILHSGKIKDLSDFPPALGLQDIF